MILACLLLFTGLTISSVAIYYSVVGLTAIFSAAAVPIMIMGVSLEVAKLVCATWIKQYWSQVPRLMKTYMVTAVTVLMLITSMGIFGFLSKAHNDQTLVSGDVGAKLAIYDEKIKTARDNIDADRKQLQQMDAAVDQVMSRSSDEKGADKANAIRNSQKRDRAALAKDIETNQKIIAQLNDEAAPIRAENRKVEAEVGPIKYIAAFIYGTAPDSSMLEKAVTWIIILIVIVFDPLAVIMLLASQMTFGWLRGEQPKEEPKTEIQLPAFLNRVRDRFKKNVESAVEPDSTFTSPVEDLEPVFEREEIPDLTDYSEGALVDTKDPEPKEELPVVEKKSLWAGFSFPMSSIFNKPKEEPVEDIINNVVNATETVQIEPSVVSELLEESPKINEEPVLITRIAHPESNPIEAPRPVNPEAAPGRNRRVMHSHLVGADNAPSLGKASHSDFGNVFPENPEKGDVYLRTDYLPNRLFKFNGDRWIEVDKQATDVYAYEEAYIKHLVEEIEAGRYDPDTLTEVEQEQIKQYLNKN
jgi:hypothetical protein